jgi:cyclopropane-fatty-acyl-phospholipid synthase
MPAAGLLPACCAPLAVEDRWTVPGTHYQRTAAAWLARLDAARGRVVPLFEEVYGAGRGRAWFERWRIFFMACEELFGSADGGEWFVAHYRFAPGG